VDPTDEPTVRCSDRTWRSDTSGTGALLQVDGDLGLLPVVAPVQQLDELRIGRARCGPGTLSPPRRRRALGTVAQCPPTPCPARARLRELLCDRLPLATIADTLNAGGYTTATGLQWTWRHVQKTRDSLALDDLAGAAL
jgi:hypothetical protein